MAIMQIQTPQGLVNVVEADRYEYWLQVFYAANVTPKVAGYYGVNGPPFVTWVVRNPDGAEEFNRLWIIERRGETERQFQFTYSPQDSRWDLLKPDGQTMVSTSKIPDPILFNVTNYYRQISYGTQVLTKSRKTYESIPALNNTVLKQEVEGDGTTSRTTTYAYYSSAPANGGNANKLQRVDYPEGDWAYYKYDPQGRMVTQYSAYGNNPPPAAGTEPNPVHCKVTEFAYTLNWADDGVDDSGDSVNPWSVRKTVVKVPVQVGSAWELREVSRTYHLSDSNGWEETQQCPEPGGLWDAPGNLRTITVKYQTPDFKAGMLQSISRPDGTAIRYDYELTDSGFTSIEQSGQPVNWASPSAIVNGLKTVTVLDELGQMQSRTSTAIYDSLDSGIVLAQETYNYKDESGNYLDPLRRSYDVTDLAGRKTQYRYGCCGLESVTDADGAATLFEYDALKRQVASQIFRGGSTGVKTANIPDAAGQVLATQRIGANGSVITLEQSQYDMLGQVVRQTNALRGVTTFTNAIVNNRLCVTNTYPDGGTRIEIYYRDGQLEEVSGTAVSPVRYQYGAEQDGAAGPWREFALATRLDLSGNPTAEWTKTYHDGAGRPYKTVYADATPGTESDNPYSQSYYNVNGQLTRQRDPDGVVTLYEYNGSGELEYTAIDLNPADTELDANLNYPIDRANDRITRTVRTVLAASAPENSRGEDILRAETFTWPTIEQDIYVRVSTTDASTSGLKTWRTVYKDAADPGSAVTTRTETRIATQGNGWRRTVTETEPDNSTTVSVYQYGRLGSVTRFSASGFRLGKTTYAYDAHGR